MNPQETQQVVARDEKWVPSVERVKISSTNIILETTVPQKVETFQVIIDIIKNSTCFKAFTISADVPEIFMQQFWYTIKKAQDTDSYEFLLANKKCIVNAVVFRIILDICPRVEGVDFADVPDDDIALTFLIDLGYKAIINKCLSGKLASNDKLRKSRIDILWGMFNRENVDYPELIWEDFAYQIDHRKEKRSRRENMPYPRFTKIIINHFLKQHKSLTNLNHKHYHTIKDDGIIPPKKSRGKGSKGKKTAEESQETVDVSEESEPEPEPAKKKTSGKRRVKKKVTLSVDDNIISDDPDAALELAKSISQTEAEAARKVHATHARNVTESVPESAKKKSGGRSSKSVVIEDTPSALKSKPATAKSKLKGAPSLTPAEQEETNIMQALKESKKTSRRQPGTGGSNEGTGSKPGVLDESTVVSTTSSEGTDEQDNEHYDDDNDDAEKDEKDGDADDEGDDHVSDKQNDDDEDDETKSDEDDIYKYKIRVRKDEDEKIKDAEVEGSDKGIDTPYLPEWIRRIGCFGDQFLKLSSDSSLVSTVKDSADADVSSLLDILIQHETPQIQSPSVQKIPVSVIPETTNLPPIPEIVTKTLVTTADPSPQVTPIISTVQQTTTPIPTPTITTDAPTITTVVPESNALTAVELRVAKLEKDVSELKTGDHSSVALVVLQSYVPTVVDSYLDTKVRDVFQKEVQAYLIHKYSLQHLPELTKKPTPTAKQESEKSPSEILKIKKEQAESQKNPQFTIKSIDKAALEEYDLKSALYQSMHANKSFNRNPANHRLYHALMEALIEDEIVLDKGVADTVKDHKRKHDDDEDVDDEDPPAGPNQGNKTKRRRTKESESSKKPSTTKETPKGKAPTKGSKTSKSASAKEPVEEPIVEVIMDDAGDDLVRDDDQPQATSKPKTSKTLNLKWFKQPPRPPTPDLEWNKCQVVLDQPTQPWFNQMVSASKDPLTFNDLMATPIDFSKHVLNGLKIENLTQDILLGPAFNLLKGTCSSSIELEYNFQECFNALIEKLDWNNTEGDRYPFDLSKPLPLQGPPGHRTVAADYFFNNDLEYLKTSDPEVNKFSKQNVYSTKAILGVKSVSVKKLHGYGHLEEIVVKRSDQQLYKFKEGDFVDLHQNDIEDMLFLAVQHKLFHLDGNVIVDFIVALRVFTRSLILKRRVEDLQLGVKSYQKKLNITKPQKTFPEIEFKEPYTPSYDPPRIVYENLDKQKRVLRVDELYKFSDGTLKSVRDEIHHRVLEFHLDYNPKMPKRKWTAVDQKRSGLMIELIDKQLREREIIINLERLVGARELEMDYKLMTQVSYQKLGFGFVNSWFRITKEVSYHSFDNISTSTNYNQQTLADSRANERPPMLEKGNYIPWESRFRRFLDNKLEDGERM
ncbi:hypothetical protein Tco_1456804 [Tanacetum coccineum]